MRVWAYVATNGDGVAPNFEPPFTTFVLARPRIRRHARPGDVVLAFNGKRLNRREPHSLCWAGVVSEVVPMSSYWDDLRFQGKKPGQSRTPDNIYLRIKGGGMVQAHNRARGPADAERDVRGVNALVLEPSWHLDSGAPVAVLPEHFGLRIVKDRRAERRFDIDESAWLNLERWLDDNLGNRPLRRQLTEAALRPVVPVM
jgi:Nucleotide modification associated domain 2